MKIQYFEDTDILHIRFRTDSPAETRDLDDNTFIDLDEQGRVCGITLEHARERIGNPEVTYERVLT